MRISLRRATTSLSTTEIIAMNPPKLVQAILKNIQNSVDNDTCGVVIIPAVLSGSTDMRVTPLERRRCDGP